MSTGKQKARSKSLSRRQIIIIVICVIMLAVAAYLIFGTVETGNDLSELRVKTEPLGEKLLSESSSARLGENPAGDVGHVVFLSLCDGKSRAVVYSGTGKTLKDAWKAANKNAEAAVRNSGVMPVWIKAEAVISSEPVAAETLYAHLPQYRHEFFRHGVDFSGDFSTALLEAELNGNKILEYDNGDIDFKYLNNYLKKSGRTQLEALPEELTVFRCIGWFSDENNELYEMNSKGLEYGRREIELVDNSFIEEIVINASEFLLRQVKDDGSFVYGYYPRFDNEIENYNIVRHASTIWSLICRYRMVPDDELAEAVRSCIAYIIGEMRYSDAETAYLYESKADEIKLGANGVGIIAMTEYMDAFGSDLYVEECRALGNGILSMLNRETGEYYHVLNGDFTFKEEYRTVYYDGEATFALCRLYSLTGDEKWLDAAKSAVNHFIEDDYTKHRDHWIAYSMNEITKHVDDEAYYTFALQNVQKNLDEIYNRDTTYHTYLELLMVSFETYQRMLDRGISVSYLEELDVPYFLKTIYARANRMLDGYFFPEYAMYMSNPARILDTFMVRHDGYRVRIDDVQHNIGGYYLYYKNYEALVESGMLEYR